MQVQPYLFFHGRCEEALEFYRSALGAQVSALMRFKDSPDKSMPNVPDPNQVMHASFRIGETEVMASDGMSGGVSEFKGFSLSVSVPDEASANKCFSALSQGGEVQMPLGKTFFSPCFGAVVDRFGVSWMVIVPDEQQKKS